MPQLWQWGLYGTPASQKSGVEPCKLKSAQVMPFQMRSVFRKVIVYIKLSFPCIYLLFSFQLWPIFLHNISPVQMRSPDTWKENKFFENFDGGQDECVLKAFSAGLSAGQFPKVPSFFRVWFFPVWAKCLFSKHDFFLQYFKNDSESSESASQTASVWLFQAVYGFAYDVWPSRWLGDNFQVAPLPSFQLCLPLLFLWLLAFSNI